ncbi:hypothetical protein QQ045_002705 [Rhodiola kirilowii]
MLYNIESASLALSSRAELKMWTIDEQQRSTLRIAINEVKVSVDEVRKSVDEMRMNLKEAQKTLQSYQKNPVRPSTTTAPSLKYFGNSDNEVPTEDRDVISYNVSSYITQVTVVNVYADHDTSVDMVFPVLQPKINQVLSIVSSNISCDMFKSMVRFTGSSKKDVASARCLVFVGLFVSFYAIELSRSQLASTECVKTEE